MDSIPKGKIQKKKKTFNINKVTKILAGDQKHSEENKTLII